MALTFTILGECLFEYFSTMQKKKKKRSNKEINNQIIKTPPKLFMNYVHNREQQQEATSQTQNHNRMDFILVCLNDKQMKTWRDNK